VRIFVLSMLVPSAVWLFSPIADVASPDDSTAQAWVSLVERFGLWAALCVTLVGAVTWISWKREMRMAARIDSLESEKAASSVAIATALTNNGTSLNRLNETIEQILRVQNEQLMTSKELNVELRCRPCIK
jgi:H+/gluconate symporter-like permease